MACSTTLERYRVIRTVIDAGSSHKEVRYEALLGWLRTLFGTGVLGCDKRSYVVCDEAMHASQLKKAWGDEALYVRPGQ
ncbi:MAG: hypothetical protein OJF50_002364 [Nitrospira sp.]|jgi:hypothetical protein|nr:hypothetical protein [Nitrospira sp.]